ncbi:hypothetical protein HU200_028146 [Digitaria exilis]|uniref:3-oxo-5-alpha-steroid 4-dehydrogenase C-terminal domain-containing protein n=1 Tax=Digitaria exilis TaxID=1010633 RepID=A0A835EUC7_9POAL|nr:hypothetical protein HU200_028146 [Digitaria exilis]CAB3451980.1 unnamed protein product [Digitaria exilis]
MWPSSTLLPFLYTPPSSAYVAAMSVVSLVSLANAGLAELRGNHMAYSKFWHVVSGAGATTTNQRQRGGGALLKSRDGMLVAYAPALVAAAASFAVPGAVDGARAEILSAALAIHFLKRVLEVLFVHRYSGSMPLDTAVTIGTSYLLSTVTMIYAQHLSHGLPDPPIDLLYPGVAVFAVGIAGNFYHHYLLSRLRAGGGGGGDKGYKIPSGGLFELVVCPHYLFEIVGFFGFAMISQTLYALALATGTAAYLTGRSCATRRWYQSKFEEFPARIKALVPFVL